MPAQLLERPAKPYVPVIPGYPETRPVTLPASIDQGPRHEAAPAPQIAHEVHQSQPRHSIARKVANFVLRRGNKVAHAPHAARAHHVEAPAYPPAMAHVQHRQSEPIAVRYRGTARVVFQEEAPAPQRAVGVAKVPVVEQQKAPEMSRPQNLLFKRGVAERLEPRGSAFPDTRKPMLTSTQMKEQMGFTLGDLQAVIHLPHAQEPVYAFRNVRFDEQDNKHVDYRFATPSQLDEIRRSIEEGDAAAAHEVGAGMLHLREKHDESNSQRPYGASLGRARWVPGRPGISHQGKRKEVTAPAAFNDIDDAVLHMRVDDDGFLTLNDIATPHHYGHGPRPKDTAEPAIIEMNPELIEPTDYTDAPIYSHRDHFRNLRNVDAPRNNPAKVDTSFV